VPKPINLHPGYELNYVTTYKVKWKMNKIKKTSYYRVRGVTFKQEYSIYHVYYLFASFGLSRNNLHDCRIPRARWPSASIAEIGKDY